MNKTKYTYHSRYIEKYEDQWCCTHTQTRGVGRLLRRSHGSRVPGSKPCPMFLKYGDYRLTNEDVSCMKLV